MNNVLDIVKGLGVRQNVSFRVLDAKTGAVIQEHVGHNSATNSLLVGIGHYLLGDGVLNQAQEMLSAYIPKYISLGTMGLKSQAYTILDGKKVPCDIGSGYVYRAQDYSIKEVTDWDSPLPEKPKKYIVTRTGVELPNATFSERSCAVAYIDSYVSGNLYYPDDPDNRYECPRARCEDYISQAPGFGADGSYPTHNNERTQDEDSPFFGLGPPATSSDNVNKELISSSYFRVPISFRDLVPAHESEQAETIDVVYSALVSTGALSSFRSGNNDYLFITEAGLWSKREYDSTSGANGLLAGYRIKLPDENKNQRMDLLENRQALQKEILCVGVNQVVQVIWKIQLGTSERFKHDPVYTVTCPNCIGG